MKEFLTKHSAAFDRSDWSAYKADLASDFSFEETPTGRRGNADEYIAMLKQWKAGFPDAKASLNTFYDAGDYCVVEVEWSGTHKGTLEGPFGSIAATNKPFSVKGVIIYKLKDGKIFESRSYFDLLGLMKQLGVTPALGAPSEKAAEKRATA
jgi:steroid delta-isomerase-like uncharacterized protein